MSGAVTITGSDAQVILAVGARLGVAVLGLNRDLRYEAAGSRLHVLVAFVAALVTVVGVQLASAGRAMELAAVTDVVTGAVAVVGFLGGSVIVARLGPAARPTRDRRR